MAYIPTNWQDGVTPVDAVHMNKIEAELVALDTKPGADLSFDGDWVAGTYQDGDTVVKDGIVFLCVGGPTTAPPDPALWGGASIAAWVPLDGAVSAATRIFSNKLLAADAQPAFRTMGGGKMEWGPGGATAPDVNLYRSPGALKTDGGFTALGNAIFRSGLAQQIVMGDVIGGGQAGIAFGNAGDTNLYRSAAGELKTDSHLEAGGQIHSMHGSTGKIILSTDNGAPTGKPLIYFGSDLAASLYRAVPTVLQANTTLKSTIADWSPGFHFNPGIGAGWALYSSIGGEASSTFNITFMGQMNWGPGGATSPDTILYRTAAGSLKTDGDLTAGRTMQAGVAGVANSIAFYTLVGNPADTGIRFLIRNHGLMEWGTGTGTLDTSLRREAAGFLGMSGIYCDGDIISGLGTGGGADRIALSTNGHLYFGSAYDSYLYRFAASCLRTDSQMWASAGVTTFIKSGAIGNADFGANARDGLIGIDVSTGRIYFRAGGTWRWVQGT